MPSSILDSIPSLDLSAQVDPNLRRDIFFQDDQSVVVGKLQGETVQAWGEFYYDSVSNEVRIDATKDGAAITPDLVFRQGDPATERVRIGSSGATSTFVQWTDGLAAPVSAAGTGRIIYDDTLKLFRFSADGAAYVSFGTGSGGGGWTDDGAIVRLTTAADSVAIGLATLVGAEKLRVTAGTSIFDFTGTTAFQVTQTGGGTPALQVNTTDSQTYFALGTAALPSISLIGDPNTGAFSPAADTLAFSTGGVERITTDTAAVTIGLPVVHPLGTAAAPSLTFTGDLNTGIFESASDIVAISTGGTTRFSISNLQLIPTVPIRATAGTAVAPSYAITGDTNTGMFQVAADSLGFTAGGTVRWTVSDVILTAALPIATALGTAAAPSRTFTGDTNTGIFSSAADTWNVSTGGVERFRITSTQVSSVGLGSAAAPAWSFTGDPNTGMYSAGADTLNFSTGGVVRLSIDSAGKVTIPGSLDPTDIILSGGGTAHFMQYGNGTTAAVAPAATGRLIYNDTLKLFQFSADGAAYVSFATGAASGWTDDGAIVRLTTAADAVAIGTATLVGTEGLRVTGRDSLFDFTSTTAFQISQTGFTGSTTKLVYDSVNGFLGISALSTSLIPNKNIQIVSGTTVNTDIELVAVGAFAPFYLGNRARGTLAALTTILDGDIMMSLEGRGYDGTAFSLGQGSVDIRAAGTWAVGDHPARLMFSTTAVGSTTLTERARFAPAGQFQFVAGGSAATPAIALLGDTNTGIAWTAADTLVLSTGGTARLTIDSVGKVTIPGALDPTSVLLSGGTALFFESNDGSTAPVSGAATGRIRYNNTTGTWQVSMQGGAYASIATGTGSGPWTTTAGVTHLVTSTETVTIGSATAGGKLFIDGDADEFQLQVQAFSGQTVSVLRIEDFSSASIFDFFLDRFVPGTDLNSVTIGTSSLRWTSMAANAFRVFDTLGDANPVAEITRSGTIGMIRFGPGGATAVDTAFRRVGISEATVSDGSGTSDGTFRPIADLSGAFGTSTFRYGTVVAMTHDVFDSSGDANPLIRIGRQGSVGIVRFGPGGASLLDASVFRVAASQISVGDINGTATGEFVPLTDNAGSVGTASLRWALVRAVTVTSGDLNLEDPDMGTAWTIREAKVEGEDKDALYAINRVNGKKYKLMLEEVAA